MYERITGAAKVLLGVLFITSAALKSLSFDDFTLNVAYYGIVRTPGIVRIIAISIIAIESGLGMALLFDWKISTQIWLLASAAVMVAAFTLLIAYAWRYAGLSECGCFGRYLKLTPGWSIVKNVALLSIIGTAWPKQDLQSSLDVNGLPLRRYIWRALLTTGTMACMVVGSVLFAKSPQAPAVPSRSMTAQNASSDKKFASYTLSGNGKVHKLSQGIHLVAMLSSSCEHCGEIVEGLNHLSQDEELPPVVAFVLGNTAEVGQFDKRYQPRFPVQPMEIGAFLERIGQAPPRFVLVKDGTEVKFWDKVIPDPLTIIQATLEATR